MPNALEPKTTASKGNSDEHNEKNKATKIVETYESSSEDDGDELDEKAILDSLYKHYDATKNEENRRIVPKNGFLENVLQSGATSCLICIATVRRNDQIWSCRHCYCIFHLNCIRRWSKDSIAQQKAKLSQQHNEHGYYNHLGEFVPPKRMRGIHWCCPQCRIEYEPSTQPEIYECFCGKEQNPAAQPWLVPHSCGEICCKNLKPDCGHKCMLLCHPGPCPPCAQYAITTCRCGKSPKMSVRCIDKDWQCEQRCRQLLSCGEHLCNQQCHAPGQCPPCSSTSMQSCVCGIETKKRSCSDLLWQCKTVCGRKYACGLHVCKKVCHAPNECGECPLGLPRSCPCGKSKVYGPCSEVVDSCGDTCQKLLPCGMHYCTQRCHRGACNQCFVIIKKRCRCGMHEKELPCYKEFTCETKCKQIRDCGKHPCSRKCCDGNCPPCDKVCGKTISCKKHKCASICHDGPCYPCKLQTQVNCSCGKTSKLVPCGRERTTRIYCGEPCRIPSKCHHQNKHRCHKNECPPCVQKCGLPNDTSNCGHLCEVRCHAAVKSTKSPIPNTATVWQQKKTEYIRLPHPRCEQMVTVTCIGGHEIAEWPCWNSKPSSCQRKCNRLLRCGNHNCQLVCHAVPNATDMNEQTGCASCDEGCTLPRPAGCTHACPLPCHLPPCKPCNTIVRSKCHCGLTQVVYTCAEFFSEIDNDAVARTKRQERLKSCGDRCQKNYPCGHRCTAICHSGLCPNPENCRKKLRIFCVCKQIKLEISCDKHRAGLTQLPCNDNCIKSRVISEQEKQRAAEHERQLEAERNRIEVEQFEKKFSKRKYKERKVERKPNTPREINWKLIGIYFGIVLSILTAIGVALYAE